MKPEDPREARNRLFGRVLIVPTVLATLLSTGAIVLSGPWRDRAAWTTVTLLVATPLLRVGWLMSRWARRGDHVFVAAGAALLAVITAGALIAVQ